MLSDEDLLALVAEDDYAAFETLFKRHNRSALMFAECLFVKWAPQRDRFEAARDAVQDAWVEILKRGFRRDRGASFKTYFRTVLRNVVFNSVFRKKGTTVGGRKGKTVMLGWEPRDQFVGLHDHDCTGEECPACRG